MLAIHEYHTDERKKIDKDKFKKTEDLEKFWAEKVKENQDKADNLMRKLREKHTEEYSQYEKHLRETIPAECKRSAAVLNAEKMMKGLAAKQRYKEAELLYEQIKVRQAQDEEEYNLQKEKKIQNLLAKKKNQQHNEEKAFQLKMDVARNELFANRDKEFKKFQNKIYSLSRKLESQQINEYNDFEMDVRGENQNTRILKGTEYGQLIKGNTNLTRTCILK